MHHTAKPPRPQPIPDYVITPTASLAYRFFDTCPRAQTLLAYSITHQAQILYALPCRTWSCRMCAEDKIKQLACHVVFAAPNRLLTLTVNPSLYSTPREAWEQTRKQVPILIRRLRDKFGSIEYLRVTEVTKQGWPHYHLLVRSGFLPHSVVKKYWSEQTGASIVDLRQVKKTFSAYTYLMKYLSKLHRLEWTERHVSMSKNFRQDKAHDKSPKFETAEPDLIRQHPANFVREQYNGYTLNRLSKNAYLLFPSASTPVATESAWSPPAVTPGPHFPPD